MSLIRARQVPHMLGPTLRAMPWGPFLAAGFLAVAYIWLEAPGRYVADRIQVLRLGALLACLGASFLLDDRTEDTLAYVPTPLLLRRAVRVALALPVAATFWWLSIKLAGQVPKAAGGPLPTEDLTREPLAVLVIAFAASSLGSRIALDRLGGVVGAPLILGILPVLVLVPQARQLVISSPADPLWHHAHKIWGSVFLVALVMFIYWSGDAGRYSIRARLRQP
ncbi:MAG: hypothetical protein M3P18_01115 [Actinomycetota bacterium]|nr:hypothetical protein [Actinomycetota bacterium]